MARSWMPYGTSGSCASSMRTVPPWPRSPMPFWRRCRKADPAMRLLYVTQGFPYPLMSGYLRQYHFIRELAARHTIRLLSLTGADFASEHAAAMAPFVEKVLTFRTPDRSGSLCRKATGRLRAWLDPERGDA